MAKTSSRGSRHEIWIEPACSPKFDETKSRRNSTALATASESGSDSGIRLPSTGCTLSLGGEGGVGVLVRGAGEVGSDDELEGMLLAPVAS